MLLLALITSSCAIFLSHIVPHGYVLAVAGIALFTISLRSGIDRTGAFGYGIILGTANALGASVWLWNTLPLSWLGIENDLAGATLVFFSWLITSIVLGIPAGFWAGVICKGTVSPISKSFLSASTWVLGEYAGMWLFALLTVGESYHPGANFSLAMLGYSAVDLPGALLLAPIGGVYAMSFMLIFLASIIAYSNVRARFKVALLIWLCFALLFVAQEYVEGAFIGAGNIPAAVVTTDFDASLSLSYEEEVARKEKLKAHVATIHDVSFTVLPEDVRFLDNVSAEELTSLPGVSQSLLIDSSSETNSARILGLTARLGTGAFVHGQEKQFLLPYGEYLPVIFKSLATIIVGEQSVATLEKHRTLSSSNTNTFGPIGSEKIGTRFCSESMSPDLFRYETLADAGILVNVASLSWFHHSPILERKLASVLRVRAAENARYMLLASNQGSSLVINPFGRIVAHSQDTEGVMYTAVSSYSLLTPYTRAGPLVLLLPLLILILIIFQPLSRSRKSEVQFNQLDEDMGSPSKKSNNETWFFVLGGILTVAVLGYVFFVNHVPTRTGNLTGKILMTLAQKDSTDLFQYSLDPSTGTLQQISLAGEKLVFVQSQSGNVAAFVGSSDEEMANTETGLRNALQVYKARVGMNGYTNITKLTSTPQDRKRSPDISEAGRVLYSTLIESSAADSQVTTAEEWGVYLANENAAPTFVTTGMYPNWIDEQSFVVVKNDGIHYMDLAHEKDELLWGLAEGKALSNMMLHVSANKQTLAWTAPDTGEVYIARVASWDPLQMDGGSVSVHGFWPVVSPDGNYVAVQAVDWDNVETDPRPRVVIFDANSLQALGVVADLDQFNQQYMFVSDWI